VPIGIQNNPETAVTVSGRITVRLVGQNATPQKQF